MTRILIAAGSLLVAFAAVAWVGPSKPPCRCQPGEPCWPSTEEWNNFNISIGGNLVQVRPLGYVCHDPTYDKLACDAVQSNSRNATWRIEQPAAVQLYNWEQWLAKNESCYLDGKQSNGCSQGRVPLYSATVESVEQLQKAVIFAKERNLRLVIRNTGHDFSGKSSAPNSFQINTSRLKGIKYTDEFIPIGARASSGPAVTIGAGVLAGELYNATAEGGHTVVAGACSTVGVAGGFIQGGGISILSPLRGLSSDNALQFEVITADGTLVIANQHQNPDLFWALRGGGGGTFGIVTSVTIRAYPEIPVVISKLHFKMPLKDGRFWNAITEQLRALPGLMEGGNAGEVSIFRLPGLDTDIFSAMTWYSMNISDTAQADNKFTSLREKFEKMGVTHMYTSDSVPKVGSFLSTPTGLDLGGIGQLHGSVLISHDFLRSGDGPSSISDAISRLEIDIGDAIVVNGLAGGQVISNKQIDSAVNPAWRSADLFVDVFRSLPSSAPPNLLRAASDKLTNVQMPVLQSIELGKMGSYLNVADPQQKNFQQAFWGDNYKKLYRLKKKWDRDGLFIVRQGVGSEDWDDEGMCPI